LLIGAHLDIGSQTKRTILLVLVLTETTKADAGPSQRHLRGQQETRADRASFL